MTSVITTSASLQQPISATIVATIAVIVATVHRCKFDDWIRIKLIEFEPTPHFYTLTLTFDLSTQKNMSLFRICQPRSFSIPSLYTFGSFLFELRCGQPNKQTDRQTASNISYYSNIGFFFYVLFSLLLSNSPMLLSCVCRHNKRRWMTTHADRQSRRG